MALLRGAFSPEGARELARVANSKHFGHEDTKEVFRCFQRLHFDRLPVTRESIVLELQGAGNVPDEVGDVLLDEILALPEPSNIPHLADGLGKLRTRSMLSELREYLDTPEALRDGAKGAVAKINEFTGSMHMVSSVRPATLSETLSEVLQRNDTPKVWVPGLGPRFDSVWKIRKGAFGLIGASSGSGKTALLINLAISIARQDTHVGIISIEMTKEELTYRAAAMEAGVHADRIEDGLMTQMEHEQVLITLQRNKAVYDRIHIVDPAVVAAEELPGYYNELVSRYGCEVIMLDYAQRVTTKSKVSGKTEAVALTSETLTAITKSTGVATIALSTLNEQVSAFGEGKKKKGLNNFKHSGQLGHDAAWAVILTMEESAGRSIDEREILVDCVKNRKGQFFSIPLVLHGPTQRMYDAGGTVVAVEDKSDGPF